MRHWLSRIGITLTLMTALAMGAAALTPQQLDTAIAAVSAEYPEAVVVEVHVESNWDNPLISMQLDNGWEVYVASTTGEIIDRTRNHTRRDDRRLARQIRDGDIRSIPEAYRSILDQLAATGPVANSDGATLYDLGFDREYGRLMVNASFRPAVQAVAVVSSATRTPGGDHHDHDRFEREGREDYREEYEDDDDGWNGGFSVYADAVTGRIISLDRGH